MGAEHQELRRHELFRFAMMLVCIVMVVLMLFAGRWYLVPVWAFNSWMWYGLWQRRKRRRAAEVAYKLREAAWRTPNSS